jgi:CDP-diacylglycerol--glycerol-3-phosphate 3-phosphatidyltransferase
VIVLRELLVSGVRTFAAARGVAIPAGMGGKTMTAVTCVAAVGAILDQPWAYPLLVVAVALTVVSAIPYLSAGWRAAVASDTP